MPIASHMKGPTSENVSPIYAVVLDKAPSGRVNKLNIYFFLPQFVIGLFYLLATR